MTCESNKQLPDFSHYETVYVLGCGVSLQNHDLKEITKEHPTVGSNSIVERARVNVWCSAHANLIGLYPAEWMNTQRWDYAFFPSKYISADGSTNRDMREDAREAVLPAVFNRVNWIEHSDEVKSPTLNREPYSYVIPMDHSARFSSGVLAADVALRLGAKHITLIGYDYIQRGGMTDADDCIRLMRMHAAYFRDYPIPVKYLGSNPILAHFHEREVQ